MKNAVKWMAQNHVAANLLMLFLVLGGIIKGLDMKQEVFPEMALDKVQITVEYPGAGPEEVEDGILLKIEDSLTGVNGIEEIRATATEGRAQVLAEVRTGEDVNLVLQDIKSEIDRIDTFPEDAEKPTVSKVLNITEVASVVVYGQASERALKEQAEGIREELLEFPEITQVKLSGVRPYEISVEISEKDLRRYNLTLDQVAQLLRRASLDLPGGNIKTQDGEIQIRTKEKRYTAAEYADVVVLAAQDGTQVRLGDIARVKDTFEETDMNAGFDGHPAAMVQVFRVGDQKPTDISRVINAYVDAKQKTYPDSLRLAVWNDQAEVLDSRISLLLENAWMGLVLVVIVLGLFLETRLALWVMLGIPISFLGAMLILPSLGVTINMISLFGFILVLGILVDDAIVVGESIFEHRQMGKPYAQAALDGALEVCVPVTFSVLTTVAAFAPLALVTGMMGKLMVVIPLVVIALLILSLVESLLILPAHLSSGKNNKTSLPAMGPLKRMRQWIEKTLQRFINGPYLSLLKTALGHRYSTIALGLALLMLSVGLLQGGVVKFSFMPKVDGDVITVDLEMPPGTPGHRTQEVVDHIVKSALDTADALSQEHTPPLRHIFALTGGHIGTGGPEGDQNAAADGHMASVAVLLTQSEKRDLSAEAFERAWRERVGEIPGVDSLVFNYNLVRMGANIDIQMAHREFTVLEEVADTIKGNLATYPGVEDIEDTYNLGKQELKLHLRPAARTLGISETDLARQVRGAFYGSEALRFQVGRNEIKVMVRYPESERQRLWDLNAMRIRTPEGGEIPLTRAARIVEGRGYAEIRRIDRKRVINVSANVDVTQANSGEILDDLWSGLLPRLKHDYPGLSFSMAGEQKEQEKSIASLKQGFLLALLVCYALMAIPFKSYTQPLLIMTVVPFGFVGALAGHILMGYQLSVLSIFGLVALSGVVVNDSLLLIDTINRNRAGGMELMEAVIGAGKRRFRPILLTSLTTFFGLTPMLLETSVQAEMLIPMAISLAFGILFATVICLVLVPSLYLVLEDVKGLVARERASMPDENAPMLKN